MAQHNRLFCTRVMTMLVLTCVFVTEDALESRGVYSGQQKPEMQVQFRNHKTYANP
jgi:hypothetical protein